MKIPPIAHRRLAEMAAGITVASEAIQLLRTEAPNVAHNTNICGKLIDFEDAAVPLLVDTRKICTSDVQERIEAIVGDVIERDLDRSLLANQATPAPKTPEEFISRMESWLDALRYHLSSGQPALVMGDLTRIRAIADCLSQDVWKLWQTEAEQPGQADEKFVERFEFSEVPSV